MTKLATILNKYNDTNILLAGHTDATGSGQYNLNLSRRRAQSVSDYISIRNVNPDWFTVHGYGESDLIASNIQPMACAKPASGSGYPGQQKLKNAAYKKTS